MSRPNCKQCGKPLRKSFWLDWPDSSPGPIGKEFEGYGFMGNDHFCSKTCGYLWAVNFQDKRKVNQPIVETADEV